MPPSPVSPRSVKIGPVVFANDQPLVLIAGPCVLEGSTLEQGTTFALRTAETLRKITRESGIGLVYKASFDKANRTSVSSFRGPGLERGLEILSRVRRE